jgi:hypothetical protein
MTDAACSWSRPRRVVLVVLEQSDDLLLRHFWLLTSINANTLDGDALLALYRQRGTAEGHWRRRCPRSRVPGGPTPPMHLPTMRRCRCLLRCL